MVTYSSNMGRRNEMKLLTLNCHSWQEESQLEKINYLAQTIKEKSYDVIALQEVNQLIEEDFVYNNVKSSNFAYILLQELKKLGITEYSLVWGLSNEIEEMYEEGLAILTKYP